MEISKILEIAAYTLPSIITGGVAYYLFSAYFKDQQHTRRWLLQKENQKESLPLRLQAYERMAIFLERINPSKLLIRVAPMNQDKNLYEAFIIDHIEQEFEHNLAQQIYITEDCWNVILSAKNTLIQNIRKTAKIEEITNADLLREKILRDLLEQESPSNIALLYLKKEVSQVI